VSSRGDSVRTRLLRIGFEDSAQAAAQLARLGEDADGLVSRLAGTADPDQALAGLVRLAERAEPGLVASLVGDESAAAQLLAVLGASQALTDHLCRHPEQWRELADPLLGASRPAAYALRDALLRAVGADPAHDTPTATLPQADSVDALRVEYRRLLTRLAARDLAHRAGVEDVSAELSDLAAATLEAALAVARAQTAGAGDARLSVIALGKCGGHELNYVSDVDVLYVFEPVEGVDERVAARIASQLASTLMQTCSDHTREGTIWPVDANLRPEGAAGPLVRTLASHRAYYERWAKAWEFQALLKARPVAGDLELGREFLSLVEPMVWQVAERDGFVGDVRAMRRRVLENIPARDADRQLKLGVGGLRDVEFAVQLLQLVHGRTDEQLRSPGTLQALDTLTTRGYVGREDGQALHAAYEFLRTLEHRIQLQHLRRTHVVPSDVASLRRIGRGMGFVKEPDRALEEAWAHHRREVRRLHEKLFYRPLLEAVARVPVAGARLTTDAAGERLAALGYADPGAALRHLEALTSGVTRTAAIQKTLLPAMLEWFADAPDPDAGLFGFRRISESLGSTHWYLKTLRDEGGIAERLARLLATSRYATDLLEREPEGVRMLGEDLRPLGSETLLERMHASAERQVDPREAVHSIRAIRRRELFRIAVGELFGETDVASVGAALSRLTDATLEATLEVASRSVREQRGLEEAPTRMAIIAMGRYGGFELSYGSDADVMFVHDPVGSVAGPDVGEEASAYAHAVANELRQLLLAPASDPPLVVDADLRPEGKQGPLVRTLASYGAYYAKWSKVWEAQALLRADAVVGDPGVREAFTALIDPLRYPEDGLSAADVTEIRRIKARVEQERLPRGADPHTHLKLGRGGLADIEWTVQLLQLRYAGRIPALRSPRTLTALDAARDAELLAASDHAALDHAWRSVSRLRNAITLVTGRSGDQLPRDARERSAISSILGYGVGRSDEMVNDYLRTTRRARAVVDRIFWG
jgi:[glutamine synthetase] adenylyltransferase / [glutamine synthetase]-adenylyl-L-tyrosine phosphorylase